MAGIKKPPRHGVYVLRYWEVRSEHPEPEVAWRFCLEDPGTGRRHGFATLDDLAAFLGEQLQPGLRPATGPLGERPARGRGRRRRQPRDSRV